MANFVSMTICLVIQDVFLNGNADERVSIAYTHIQLVNFIIFLKVYFDSSLLMMSYMYVRHRYAFKTHARDKILLITFTIISLLVIIYKQLAFGFWRACMNIHEAEC